MNPFHLAITVTNLDEAHHFYTTLFNCQTGRTSDQWVDLNFFGHQITLHTHNTDVTPAFIQQVDGHDIPVGHFGIILQWEQWHTLKDHFIDHQVQFIVEPHIRFKNKPGHQATMFIQDPSGNVLEFKSFKDQEQIFSNYSN